MEFNQSLITWLQRGLRNASASAVEMQQEAGVAQDLKLLAGFGAEVAIARMQCLQVAPCLP